jgi:hypothetical protein
MSRKVASQNVVEAVAEIGSKCYRERDELRSECAVLRLQRDDLRAALEKVLKTRDAEAKAAMAYEVSASNFSDSGPERKTHIRTLVAASNAEREARVLLLTLRA